MSYRIAASVAVLATAALAKTDLAGCVSSDSVVAPTYGGTPYASVVWYVPGTGEICAPLDCGGGRAPPKTDVPGCAGYTGTDKYSPSFLPLKTDAVVAATPGHTVMPSVMTPAPDRAVPTAPDSVSEDMPRETDLPESECTAETDLPEPTEAPPAPVTHVVSPPDMNATATQMAPTHFLTTPLPVADRPTATMRNGSAVTPAPGVVTAAAAMGASRELFGLGAVMAIAAAFL
ncbi:hypothetical protein LX36DRAFT_593357 [Colletotrichum falcatum]|nr:hypothetical protein LX36DRAFT_593357 [Colletotrichum falcatum]